MGWVGVGTLLAVACFVLYQYPARSWAVQPPSSPHSPEQKPAKPPSDPDPRAKTAETGDSPKPSGALEPSPIDDSDTTAESQTTPKASASNTSTVQIPSLRLDGDSATTEESRPKQMNGSAESPSNAAKPPPQPAKASSSSLMPPPPLPRKREGQQNPGQAGTPSSEGQYPPRLSGVNSLRPRPSPGSSLRPPPSAASMHRPPPSAASSLRMPENNRPANNTLSPNPRTPKPSNTRRAILEPGYSPLDWAALKSNPKNNLRGNNVPPHLIKVTPSMLKAQNGRKGTDAWTSYQGKIYNISPYLPYHPGGKGELLRGAGKDAGNLFFEVHPWVNWDAILGECLVGILVSEHEGLNDTNALDAMD